MYKITLETMALNYANVNQETVKEFSFETKQEAKKAFKVLVKEYNMTKSPISSYWNLSSNLELRTNY